MLSKMTPRLLLLVKTRIYDFSKWRKIEIGKPVTERQNGTKGQRPSVIRYVKPRHQYESFGAVSYSQVGVIKMPEKCVVFG